MFLFFWVWCRGPFWRGPAILRTVLIRSDCNFGRCEKAFAKNQRHGRTRSGRHVTGPRPSGPAVKLKKKKKRRERKDQHTHTHTHTRRLKKKYFRRKKRRCCTPHYWFQRAPLSVMNRTRLALGPIRCGPPRAMLPSFFLLCPLVSARQSGHYETRCSDCGTIKKRQKDDGRNRVHPRGTQRLDAADSFSFRRAEREDATVPSYYFSRTRFYLFVYLFFPGVKTGPTADAAVRRLGSIFFCCCPSKLKIMIKLHVTPRIHSGTGLRSILFFFRNRN